MAVFSDPNCLKLLEYFFFYLPDPHDLVTRTYCIYEALCVAICYKIERLSPQEDAFSHTLGILLTK
jgi:hypothetical protein